MIGKVKSFSRQHGYGFIEAGDQEYYFHAKNCQGIPAVGSIVKFRPIKTEKGNAALSVRGEET